MEGQILTPLQIWQNHNASVQPLNYNIVSKKFVGDVCVMDIFFSAVANETGIDRAFVKVAYPKGGKSLPSILYVPDAKQVITDKLVVDFASRGYAVFCVDVMAAGSIEGKKTKYSSEHSYGEFAKAGAHLALAEPDAWGTSVYVWSVVARRTLTLMRRLYMVDKENISIIGNQGGASVMWQVAAFDERIRSAVAVNNAGKTSDFWNDEKEPSVSEQKWLIGCAIPAYAKFVKCPMLYVGSSNSTVTCVERVWETLKFLPEETAKRRSISIGTSEQLEKETKTTIFEWLEMTLKKTKPIIENCELNLENQSGKLVAEVIVPKNLDVSEIIVAYSDDKCVPEFKNWKRINVELGKEKNETVIDVFYEDRRITVFANVYLSDGSMWSTRLKGIEIDDKFILKPFRKSRILYDKKMGIYAFLAETKEALYVPRDTVSFKKGSLDIVGISTKEGSLVSFHISDERFSGEVDSILQFDVFSENAMQIELKMWVEQDDKVLTYSAPFSVRGGEWEKISRTLQDFKDEKMNSLKAWDKVKKMAFINVPNVIFGNFLWV